MFRSLVLPVGLILSFLCSATLTKADGQLMNGVRPFICADLSSPIVLFETNGEWKAASEPTGEVKPTDTGWRYEETASGDVWYLHEKSDNSWVLNGLSEYGHLTLDCFDIFDSVSEVLTIIQPKLDDNISSALERLAAVNHELATTLKAYESLQAEHEILKKSLASDISPAEFVPPMTGAELDVLNTSISSCWSVDPGAVWMNTAVTVAFALNPDGTPVAGSLRLAGFEGGSEATARQSYEAARRAILRCTARGVPLPPEKYEHWKELKMTFDPSTMRIR